MEFIRKGGFTLIEVMLSIGVLSIGILAVTSMITAAAKTARITAITDEAVFDAQNEIAVAASVCAENMGASGEKNIGQCKIQWKLAEKTLDQGTNSNYKIFEVIVRGASTNRERIKTFYILN